MSTRSTRSTKEGMREGGERRRRRSTRSTKSTREGEREGGKGGRRRRRKNHICSCFLQPRGQGSQTPAGRL